MPAWIHNRAEHLLAKNPDMKKSTAFALATQQSHAVGKTPKGYGTKAGKSEAKQKYDAPKKEYTKASNPGDLETPKLSDKPKTEWTGSKMKKKESCGTMKYASFFDELSKIAVHAGDSPYLSDQIGLSKVRRTRAAAPEPKFRIKQGMIPLGRPKVNPSSPQAKLLKSQRVGTPDDPKGAQFKPLHMAKPPKPTSSSSSSSYKRSSSVKMPSLPKFGSVKLGQTKAEGAGVSFPAKPPPSGQPYATGPKFRLAGLPVGGGQQPGASVPSPVPSKDSPVKLSWALSQFSGSLGSPRVPQASMIPPFSAARVGAPDPQLKEGGSKPSSYILDHKRSGKEKKAAPLTPAGRLASTQQEGKPKMTGFSGPSISDVSKPIGYGKKLPGTLKNRI